VAVKAVQYLARKIKHGEVKLEEEKVEHAVQRVPEKP